jgi:hypothetical protein
MDFKQEVNGVDAAKAEQPASGSAAAKVRLRHPHTGDTQEVDATPDKLVPLMIQGYQQIPPEIPATKGV